MDVHSSCMEHSIAFATSLVVADESSVVEAANWFKSLRNFHVRTNNINKDIRNTYHSQAKNLECTFEYHTGPDVYYTHHLSVSFGARCKIQFDIQGNLSLTASKQETEKYQKITSITKNPLDWLGLYNLRNRFAFTNQIAPCL